MNLNILPTSQKNVRIGQYIYISEKISEQTTFLFGNIPISSQNCHKICVKSIYTFLLYEEGALKPFLSKIF